MNFLKGLTDPKKEMNAIDKTALRLTICLAVGVIGYALASNSIMKQIDEKSTQIDQETTKVEAQIQTVNSQTSDIKQGKNSYDQMYNMSS